MSLSNDPGADEARQINASERTRVIKTRRRIALEELPVVPEPKVQCPGCDSTNVERKRTLSLHDGGKFRYTTCRACDLRFVVYVESNEDSCP